MRALPLRNNAHWALPRSAPPPTQDGRRVLLLERDFSQPDRIVGELLQPGGYLMLKRMGLEDCTDGIDSQRVSRGVKHTTGRVAGSWQGSTRRERRARGCRGWRWPCQWRCSGCRSWAEGRVRAVPRILPGQLAADEAPAAAQSGRRRRRLRRRGPAAPAATRLQTACAPPAGGLRACSPLAYGAQALRSPRPQPGN
jgi:hypothetical protein